MVEISLSYAEPRTTFQPCAVKSAAYKVTGKTVTPLQHDAKQSIDPTTRDASAAIALLVQPKLKLQNQRTNVGPGT